MARSRIKAGPEQVTITVGELPEETMLVKGERVVVPPPVPSSVPVGGKTVRLVKCGTLTVGNATVKTATLEIE